MASIPRLAWVCCHHRYLLLVTLPLLTHSGRQFNSGRLAQYMHADIPRPALEPMAVDVLQSWAGYTVLTCPARTSDATNMHQWKCIRTQTSQCLSVSQSSWTKLASRSITIKDGLLEHVFGANPVDAFYTAFLSTMLKASTGLAPNTCSSSPSLMVTSLGLPVLSMTSNALVQAVLCTDLEAQSLAHTQSEVSVIPHTAPPYRHTLSMEPQAEQQFQ